MTTQLEHARKGFLTKEMQAVAEAEGVTEAFVLARNTRQERRPLQKETCTMCGDFCAMKKGMEIFETDITDKRGSL